MILYQLLRLAIGIIVAMVLLSLGLLYAIIWVIVAVIKWGYRRDRELAEEAELARREEPDHPRT